MERENHKMTFKALNVSAKKARPTDKLKIKSFIKTSILQGPQI